jgi:hypothetical protein
MPKELYVAVSAIFSPCAKPSANPRAQNVPKTKVERVKLVGN